MVTSLEMFRTLKWTKKQFKVSIETFILKGGGRQFVKNITHKPVKTLKNRQREAIKFDCLLKHAECRFHKKVYLSSGIGGSYSVLVNYQSLCSISSPHQLFFSINYKGNGLLLVRFIEQ